jgi:hypothetical protein
MRAERAINKSRFSPAFLARFGMTRVARLAQIAFGFAQARLSRRKERLFGMTTKFIHAESLGERNLIDHAES